MEKARNVMPHLPLQGGKGRTRRRKRVREKEETKRPRAEVEVEVEKSGNSTPGYNKPPSEIPCRFLYAFGSCNKGKECDFAHRTPSAAEIKEYGFYKNDPSKSGGKDSKGKAKGKCTPFFDSGKCRFGDACIFSHGDGKDKAKPKSKAKAKAKGKGKTRAKSAPAVEGDGDWEEYDEEAACDDGWYEEE